MWLAKRDQYLVAADGESTQLINKMEPGETAFFKVVRMRSGPWHRWYFACCAEIGKNQDPQRSAETIDYAIRFWSGHVEEARDIKGRVLEVAKRLAFDKLTAEEWSAIWPQFELTMIEKFGFDPELWK